VIPDLQKELAFWVDKLRLGNWKIAIRYETDPRAPDTGAPVYGYCVRQLDIPSADIVIRTPASAADIAETHDTIVHELLHCRIANPEGSRVLEENAVWTLAPLLTELRLNAPAKAMILCQALARRGTLTARSRAQKEGYAKMDPAQLAELSLQAGQLISQEGLSEEVKSLLQQLIALAAGGAPEMPPEGEPVPPKEGEKPGEPLMGLQKQERDDPKAKTAAKVGALLTKLQTALGGGDVQLKALEAKLAEDRAAAVDALLDARTDLKDKPKAVARLREIGNREGLAKLREDLAELVPAPKEAKPEMHAKLGEEKPIRGSNTAAKAMPSGDKGVDRLFRIINTDPTSDGVTIPANNTGKLVEFSVVEAFAKIKKNAEQAREAQRAKMGGTP
jgi:hypothetical protein